VNAEAPLATARADVVAELQVLRSTAAHVEGSIVASTDGLVIAHDLGNTETYGIEPESVAALAAVSLGLSQRVTDTASYGQLREFVIRGAFGQVVTYPAGERALLTVLFGGAAEVDHAAVSEVAARIADLLVDAWQDDAATWRSRLA
jgi:uncharacterized protein